MKNCSTSTSAEFTRESRDQRVQKKYRERNSAGYALKKYGAHTYC